MEIRKFVHGEQTRELFALVGEYCVDVKIRADLGLPISSAPGDLWFVADDAERGVVGFCVLTQERTGRQAKLHGFYAKTHIVAKALRKAATEAAEDLGAGAMVYTGPAEVEEPWARDGWTPGQARGQYVTYTKGL